MIRPSVPLDDDGAQMNKARLCSIAEAVSWALHYGWPSTIQRAPGWWLLKMEEGDE